MNSERLTGSGIVVVARRVEFLVESTDRSERSEPPLPVVHLSDLTIDRGHAREGGLDPLVLSFQANQSLRQLLVD